MEEVSVCLLGGKLMFQVFSVIELQNSNATESKNVCEKE